MARNAMIFGDSYSTFRGYIPEGYAVYYHEAEGQENTDVRKVTETWWHQVVSETGLNLIQNNSWSGSTVCHTGYNNTDCSKTNSFIYRLRKLTEEGFFTENRIDTVFVFGGTNDSWADDPLGTLKFDDIQEADLFCVLPGISYFLQTLKNTLPQADIYCLINTELKPEIADGFLQVCQKTGITPVTFDYIDKNCGHPTVQGMADIKNGVLRLLK